MNSSCGRPPSCYKHMKSPGSENTPFPFAEQSLILTDTSMGAEEHPGPSSIMCRFAHSQLCGEGAEELQPTETATDAMLTFKDEKRPQAHCLHRDEFRSVSAEIEANPESTANSQSLFLKFL